MSKCPSLVLNAETRTTGHQEKYFNPRLEVCDRPECKVLHADDVVIEPIFNGVCGTDVSLLSTEQGGEIRFKGPAKLPVVIGHEFTGMVKAVGNDSTFKAGDYVVAESIEACGSCEQCLLGHLNQCLNIELVGLTKDGALSNTVRVKDRHVYSINKLIERFGLKKALEVATLLEPAGCSYNALMIDVYGNTQSKILPDSRVAVFGCGPIGLLNIALAKAQGAASIVAFDYVAAKVELALSMGANHAFVVDDSLQQNYLNVTGGLKANIVLEASGNAKAVADALAIIAPRGVLLAQGRLPHSALPIDPNRLISEAISIVGVRGHAGYGIFESLINWFAEDSINFDNLIHSKKFSFYDVLDAVDFAKTQAGKILVVNPKYKDQFG